MESIINYYLFNEQGRVAEIYYLALHHQICVMFEADE